MLRSLSVKNYALIESLDIEFDEKLNILTGETGSGKSIILGAMTLLSGERADTSSVQEGKKKCIVEGAFDMKGLNLKALFESADLDYEPLTVIRREINANGKSRAFVNDTPVNLKVLREIGLKLIDLHAQHQTLKINDPGYQLGLLDRYAGVTDELSTYRDAYRLFRRHAEALQEAEEEGRKNRQNLDFMRFQLEELEAARLDEIDEAALEEELNLLENADEISAGLSKAAYALSEAEVSAASALREAREAFGGLAKYGKTYEELRERCKSAEIETVDMAAETEALLSNTESDPSKLAKLEAIRDTLYRLGMKHGTEGISGLIALRDSLKKSVSDADNLDDRLGEMRTALETALKETEKRARVLTEKRRKAVQPLCAEITTVLKTLNMKDAHLEVNLMPAENPGPSGADRAEFLFSANAGRKPAPLKDTASGGELSRLMLAVKQIGARNAGRSTIVFDEIDTGVSGEVADSMGRIMQAMSAGIQVISITHLPQIAAKGDAHFKVFKTVESGATVTKISPLGENDRVTEIAQMLSGAKTTDAAMANAKALLSAD